MLMSCSVVVHQGSKECNGPSGNVDVMLSCSSPVVMLMLCSVVVHQGSGEDGSQYDDDFDFHPVSKPDQLVTHVEIVFLDYLMSSSCFIAFLSRGYTFKAFSIN